MDKSFADYMAEFEEKGKAFRDHMAEKRKKEAARKKLERGTPPLPERLGRIYDARNEQDAKDAIAELEKSKGKIKDIRQLTQYKH